MSSLIPISYFSVRNFIELRLEIYTFMNYPQKHELLIQITYDLFSSFIMFS